jgi:hypothetical protein
MRGPACVFLILFCSALCLSSCALLPERARSDKDTAGIPEKRQGSEAERLLSSLKKINRSIKTFKGTGRIKISGKNKPPFSADIAWAAEDNDKLSVALRDILGRPVARFAADGEWICFLSHSDNRFHKERQDDSGLENFLSVPVRITDIVMLLSGRVPVYEFDSAGISRSGNGGCILELDRKWTGTAQKIYLSEDCEKPEGIEIFDRWGKLVYKASFEGEKNVNEYNIHPRIIVSDDDGDSLMFDIDKYWTDVPVPRSAFVLNIADKNGE